MAATKRLLQFKKQALLLYKAIKTLGKDSSALVDQSPLIASLCYQNIKIKPQRPYQI